MEKNEESLQDYMADIITLEDDNGEEHSFELIDIIERDERRFMAMIPYYENPVEEVEDIGDLFILEAVMEDGEEVLVSIEDETLLNNLYDEFIEKLSDYYEFEK